MILFIFYIFLSILLYYSLKNIKCKRNSTDLFFEQYSPKNDLLKISQIINSYDELVYAFYKEKSISVYNFYKYFEIITVNLLINWVIETLEEKDKVVKFKNHVRILNLIDKYTDIFIIDQFYLEEIKISFIYKLIDCLKNLNQEKIFLVYKYIENIYIENIYFHSYIKTQINFNPSIESLEINDLKIHFYLNFLKTKNINFLQYN